MKTEEYYMNEAFKETMKAFDLEEIPVGAVVVDKNGSIIGRGHNIKEKTYKVIGHAEIEAITKANKKINNWRLNDCSLYVTLEPCEMCKKVIQEANIENIYYCLSNNSKKIDKSNYNKINNENLINKYNKVFKESFNKIRWFFFIYVSRETYEKIFPGK